MNLFTNVGRCYKKFGIFSGRAPRSEYWYFILYFWVTYLVLAFVDVSIGAFAGESSIGFFSLLFYIGNVIPLLSGSLSNIIAITKARLKIGIIDDNTHQPDMPTSWSRRVKTDNKYGRNPLEAA